MPDTEVVPNRSGRKRVYTDEERIERKRASSKARYDKDPKKANAATRAWAEAHPEQTLANTNRWRNAHREDVNEAGKLRARTKRASWTPEELQEFKDSLRKSVLKTKYGITPEDYDQQLAKQNGVCAICHSPEKALDRYSGKPRRLAIDHDPKTGKPRGLLCRACNQLLGQLGDNEEGVMRFISYLRTPWKA